jgi:hypothetical protein
MLMLIVKHRTLLGLRGLSIPTMISAKVMAMDREVRCSQDTHLRHHLILNKGINRTTLLRPILTHRHPCRPFRRLLGIHIPILLSRVLDELVIKP